MGGKNAIIIDNDADLDEAVQGVVYSAFGFQGQKCSACSRVIVLEEIYEPFLTRLTEATKSLKVLPAENPNSYLSAVVDEEAYIRIKKTIQQASEECHLHYQSPVSEEGYYVSPTLFTEVKFDSQIAQNEIFGPVLAIIKVKTIDEALFVANSTPYALTGGIYSRSPGNIEFSKSHFEVGNLYINRTITGAIVKRHPFGGFKMSGVGTKAGGINYLKQFMDERIITENLMRRGFAPLEDEL